MLKKNRTRQKQLSYIRQHKMNIEEHDNYIHYFVSPMANQTQNTIPQNTTRFVEVIKTKGFPNWVLMLTYIF
jgi:hypothetical protein